MWKRTLAALSVAEYSLTGIETRPKLSEREAIERAAMASPSSKKTVRKDATRIAPAASDGRTAVAEKPPTLAEYQAHYNTARPHQGIAQQVPDTDRSIPRVIVTDFDTARILRRPVLSGLINEYIRAA